MLFGILNTSLFHGVKNDLIIEKADSAKTAAHRKARNKVAERLYKSIQDVDADPADKKKKKAKLARYRRRYAQSGRFNAYLVFTEEIPPPFIEETFYKLLDNLYGHLDFYRAAKESGRLKRMFEDFRSAGLDILGTKGSKKKRNLTFKDLKDNVPEMEEPSKRLFDKISRGTTYYNTATHEGIPRLEDFVYLSAANAKKPIRWKIACPELLFATFGDFARQILEFEKEQIAERPYEFTMMSRTDLISLLEMDLEMYQAFDAFKEFLDERAPVIKPKDIVVLDHINKIKVSIPKSPGLQ